MKNLKIALVGYGKMGKAIESIAIARGHSVVARLNAADKLTSQNLANADIAIEFSRPESAAQNIGQLLDLGIPVVCGTTGWLENYDQIAQKTHDTGGGFFYASNYSLGVNIFFELNRQLAKLMNPQEEYEVSMTEIHHTAKLDAPSGTAITLADGIVENLARKARWADVDAPPQYPDDMATIFIKSERVDPTPGTHVVQYKSAVDTLEISHVAHSRTGFATGAVVAAEWLVGKKGVFSMRDLLGF